MPGREEPKGWMCCVQAMLMPWRIARLSFGVSVLTSSLWGGAALLWYTIAIVVYVEVSLSEPWGTWQSLFNEVPDAFFKSLYFAAWILTLYVLLFVSPSLVMKKNRYLAVVAALSFLCVALLFTVWIVMAAFVTWSGDIARQPPVLKAIAQWPPIQVVGSCAWLPMLLLGWFIMLIYGLKASGRIARLRQDSNCVCGYDLRGSIAGGSTTCPECGLDIPKFMLAKPPSLITRPAREE